MHVYVIVADHVVIVMLSKAKVNLITLLKQIDKAFMSEF